MDVLEKQTVQQLIDNQIQMLNKLETLTNIVSQLTNTIIKYDNDYQNDLAAGKSFIIKQKFSGNSNCWVSGNGAVLATSSGSGKIIKWNDSSVYDSYVDCMTQFDSTSKRYYGLCKIERHSYKFVSDGTNWISMLLSA